MRHGYDTRRTEARLTEVKRDTIGGQRNYDYLGTKLFNSSPPDLRNLLYTAKLKSVKFNLINIRRNYNETIKIPSCFH